MGYTGQVTVYRGSFTTCGICGVLWVCGREILTDSITLLRGIFVINWHTPWLYTVQVFPFVWEQIEVLFLPPEIFGGVGLIALLGDS